HYLTPARAAPTRPSPAGIPAELAPPEAPAVWHYVADDGEPQGPVTRDHLLGLWNKGTLSPATLVWKEGMGTWVAITSPETGLGLTPARARRRLSRRVWLGGAAAAGVLVLAGLGWAAYKFWARGPVITDVINRDKDLSAALGLVVCGVHVTQPDGKQL